MSDIVRKLREPPFGTETSERNLMNAAADTITRLRAENEKLRVALARAAHELELLYFFAISNGISKEGIPPHVQARAALSGDEI